MSQKRYNKPQKGTTEWHIPLNENFDRLDRDVPVVDTESNLEAHAPSQGKLFFATDTGRRFLGDGDQWVNFPYPTETSSPSETEPDEPEEPAADVVVRNGDGGVLAVRDGETFASGSADEVFDRVAESLASGEHVRVEAGEYVVHTPTILKDVDNVVWESAGTVRLDDRGTKCNQMFMFDNVNDSVVRGGTYDFDMHNNVDDGKPGTQTVLQPRHLSGLEIDDVTLLNGRNALILGGMVENVEIRHSTLRGSDERGIYFNGSSNVEVHHCEITDVPSGCLRFRGGATNWYSHDNTLVTTPGRFGPVYVAGGTFDGFHVRNDDATVNGDGTIFWDRFIGQDDGIAGLTIEDSHFAAGDPPRDLLRLRADDNPGTEVPWHQIVVRNNTYDGVSENTN